MVAPIHNIVLRKTRSISEEIMNIAPARCLAGRRTMAPTNPH
jgi:hypothetical protein